MSSFQEYGGCQNIFKIESQSQTLQEISMLSSMKDRVPIWLAKAPSQGDVVFKLVPARTNI